MEQYLEKAKELISGYQINDEDIRKFIEKWEIYYKEQISHGLAKNILTTYWDTLEDRKKLYIGNKKTMQEFIRYCQSQQYRFHYKSYNGIKEVLLYYIDFMDISIDYYLFTNTFTQLFLRVLKKFDPEKKVIFAGESPIQPEISLAAKYFANQRILFSTEIKSTGFQAQQLHNFWLLNFKKYINNFNIGLINWNTLFYLAEEIAQKCKEHSILIDQFKCSTVSKICSDIFIEYPSKTTHKNLLSIVRHNYPEVCFIHSSDQKYYLKYIKYLQKNTLLTLQNPTKSQQKIQNDWKLLFQKDISLDTTKYILATLWYQYPECFEEYNNVFLQFQDMYLTSTESINQHNRSILIINELNNLRKKFPLYSHEQLKELQSYLFKKKLNITNSQTLQLCWNDLFQETLVETQSKKIFKYLKGQCYVIGSPDTKQFKFIQYLKETSQTINLDLTGYRLSQKIWKKLFDIHIPIPMIRNELFEMKQKCSLHFTHGKFSYLNHLLENIIHNSILIDNGPSGFKEFQILLSKWVFKKFTMEESKKLFTNIKKLYPECFTGEFDLSDHNILVNIDEENKRELLAIFSEYCQKNGIVFSQKNPNTDLFQESWRKCFESYSKCNIGN